MSTPQTGWTREQLAIGAVVCGVLAFAGIVNVTLANELWMTVVALAVTALGIVGCVACLRAAFGRRPGR